MEKENLTDSQKLDIIERKIRKIETNSYIHIAIVLLGFLGILSISALVGKAKELKSKL